MTFTVELPMPPSLNNAFVNRKPWVNKDGKLVTGRTKSPEYRAWQRDAILATYAQVRADRRVPGKTAVRIELPEACRLDLDNAIKPLLDALVAANRIDDDRHVVLLTVAKVRPWPTALVVVSKAPGGTAA